MVVTPSKKSATILLPLFFKRGENRPKQKRVKRRVMVVNKGMQMLMDKRQKTEKPLNSDLHGRCQQFKSARAYQ